MIAERDWREAFRVLSGHTTHRSFTTGEQTYHDGEPVPDVLCPFLNDVWPSTEQQRERWAKRHEQVRLDGKSDP